MYKKSVLKKCILLYVFLASVLAGCNSKTLLFKSSILLSRYDTYSVKFQSTQPQAVISFFLEGDYRCLDSAGIEFSIEDEFGDTFARGIKTEGDFSGRDFRNRKLFVLEFAPTNTEEYEFYLELVGEFEEGEFEQGCNFDLEIIQSGVNRNSAPSISDESSNSRNSQNLSNSDPISQNLLNSTRS